MRVVVHQIFVHQIVVHQIFVHQPQLVLTNVKNVARVGNRE